MSQQSILRVPQDEGRVGPFLVIPFPHPQGCRTWLLGEPASREALALDVHLDFVAAVANEVHRRGWTLRYVVDTHTHADHPSGSRELARRTGAERIAHAKAEHAGVARHPADGERLPLGAAHVMVRHAPGHTPDHLVVLTDEALFSGDTLLLGGVARTDFLGGDAGQLHDTLHRIVAGLDDGVRLYPGHDYRGREHGTIGAERADNPWLAMDREEFVRQLGANPPPRPANMDALLRLNRTGEDIPPSVTAAEAVERVLLGGATSVIDVRSGVEYAAEHVARSQHIPLDRLREQADDVRATPAPRLLLCQAGPRAEAARALLAGLDVSGLSVVEGGLSAFARAGGATERGQAVVSLERQVRIVAGALVLAGLGLGVLVHPAFLGLVAFVGAGQVFAGVTNWCGMGLLLARAPWNRRPSAGASVAAGACAASVAVDRPAPVPAACAAPLPGREGS